MTFEHIITLLIALFTITANGFAGVLFWRIKEMDKQIQSLERELSAVRYNYLNRFDEIKGIMSTNHLQISEKIAILETLLKQHLN